MLTARANPFDYSLILLLSAIFGASFMLTNVALEGIPAATLVAIRLIIAALFFIGLMIFSRQKLPTFGKVWIMIAIVALVGNALPFFLISWGQERVDAGLAAILMATMPLMTVIIAHFVTVDEKLTLYKIAGFLLGLIGVVLIMGFDQLGSLAEQTVRQYAIIGGALCYAFSAIATKSIVKLPRWAMMAGVMMLSSAMIAPVSIWYDDPIQLFAAGPPETVVIVSALLLAIFPTIIGTALVFVIINRQGASFLSQINFLVPVFGVFWAALFLGEILPANAVVALGLILGGIAIARLKTSPQKILGEGGK